MRKRAGWRILIPFLLVLASCRALAPDAVNPSPPPQATQTSLSAAPNASGTPALTITATPLAAVPSPAPVSPTAENPPTSPAPIPTHTATVEDKSYSVKFHPDGGLFVGDQISIEVISPPGMNLNGKQVLLEFADGQTAQAGFGGYGIANRFQATFWWVWDTAGETAGAHDLTFSIIPDGPVWSETISLSPRAALPEIEQNAAWVTSESDCCLVSYITGTAAERDLDFLLASLDRQAQQALQSLGGELSEPIEITFLPRVLGHGGFASTGISLSYLDRNYSGSNSEIVFHHEIAHVVDERLGGEMRPSMLVEGLAVYLSGGHFKGEPLLSRAAALLPPKSGCTPRDNIPTSVTSAQNVCSLDLYLPLARLADDFYNAQHEAGYLQAAALVEYMLDTWGWEAYMSFYRDIHNQPPTPDDLQEAGGPQVLAMQAALEQHFGLTFEELEKGFLHALRQEPLLLQHIDDVRLSVLYFDTLRRYQQLMDPSAHFQTAWLPDSTQMRLRGIVADYLRQPAAAENLALEIMLAAANQAYLQADYARAESSLQVIQSVLDEIQAGNPQPFAQHPPAQDYLDLVHTTQQAGYSPQIISLNSNLARVWANAAGPELVEIHFYRQVQGWGLASVQ